MASKCGAAAAAAAVTVLSGAGSLSFAQAGGSAAVQLRSSRTSAAATSVGQAVRSEHAALSTVAAGSTLAGVSLVATSAARGRRCRLARPATGVAAVGQQITWKGMAGQIQYVGPVDFAAGEWVGIALAEAKGLHDGNVFGKQYFQCQPKHGVFCPSADLAAMAAPPDATPVAGAVAPTAPAAAAAPAGSISVGQRVGVLGTTGTVQYYGQVKFAAGEWVGVQLDEPKGMHDGSVFGVSYFSCPPKTGIFCQPSQLTVVGGAPAAPAMPVAAAPVAVPAAPVAPPAPVAAPAGTFPIGTRVTWSGLEGTVKYCGDVKFATGEWVGIELDLNKGLYDGTVLGETYFSCDPMRGIFSEVARVTAA